jgi:hypothetical protein
MRVANTYQSNLPAGGASLPKEVSQLFELLNIPQIRLGRGTTSTARNAIDSRLALAKWAIDVKIAPSVNAKKITGLKGTFGIQIQTGNLARLALDFLKMQYLFDKGRISLAILVLPTKVVADQIGSNIANFEKAIDDMNLFEHQIKVPFLLIGIE